MKFKGVFVPIVVVALIVGVGMLVNGCSDNPVASGPGVQVNLAAKFSNSVVGFPLSKAFGTDAVDSIRIDSVVVVVEKIKFYAHIDTVLVDTTGRGDDKGEHHGDDPDSSLMFRGPFVIHVRDTLAVNFADQVIPAGNYDGVKFKIHRLQRGEHHWDSDWRHHGMIIVPTDSSIEGSSIVIWGEVRKEGVWTPFELNVDMELEFKVKGDFTVPEATSSIQIAFQFDLGAWFTNPDTGAVIDPTDPDNLWKIKWAIRRAFGTMRCGRDFNHDGHPGD